MFLLVSFSKARFLSVVSLSQACMLSIKLSYLTQLSTFLRLKYKLQNC